MWVSEGGEVVGAVTIGGCVDARVIEVAGQVLRDGKSTLLEMALGEEDAAALGMTCAGTVEVLVEPSNPSDPQDPVTRALSVAGREVAAGRRVAIVVPLTGGRGGRLLVRETGQRSGTLGSPDVDLAAATLAIDRLERGESGAALVTTPDGDLRVFVELHAPPPTLVVFGATHVAMPLVELARTVGLRTVVVDGRDQFATPERFPQADELIVGMPSDIAGTLPLGASSLVVLLSHDYKYDLPVLRAVLESRAAYVGCLGSARRGKAMLEFLAEQGVPAESLARVRMPIGLDIGAKSAPEIALSVLAEALAVLRGRPGGAMRDRRTTVSASS
jgi:xanthine dehydrogenase accessory factor